MGEIHNPTEDAEAVKLLQAMPKAAKLWLNHHIGNSLQVLLNSEKVNNPEHVVRAAKHIIEDMKRIGCFELL